MTKHSPLQQDINSWLLRSETQNSAAGRNCHYFQIKINNRFVFETLKGSHQYNQRLFQSRLVPNTTTKNIDTALKTAKNHRRLSNRCLPV